MRLLALQGNYAGEDSPYARAKADDEKKKVVDPKDMWIDIGASHREDAESVIAIGDAVTVQLGIQEMRNGLANAPAMALYAEIKQRLTGFAGRVRAAAPALPDAL